MKTVPLIHCATTSHALGHPCLVSLLLCHPYIPHFLIRRIFYLLASSPFLPHSHVLYEMKIKLGHNAHIKISIHLRKGNSLSELYVGINNIYKFTLPEAVCLLMFTLVTFVLVNSYHWTSVYQV